MKYIYLVFTLFFCTTLLAQQSVAIKRASLSTAPQTIQNGVITVQQSVGFMGLMHTSQQNNNTTISGFLLPSVRNSLLDPETSIQWLLYPNPFSTHINIDFSAPVSGAMKLLLFDVTGQLIVEKTLEAKQQQRIPMEHLAQGEYIIQINVMGKSFSAQLLNYKNN